MIFFIKHLYSSCAASMCMCSMVEIYVQNVCCIYTAYIYIYFNHAAHIRHVCSIILYVFYNHAAHNLTAYMLRIIILQPCCTYLACIQHTCCTYITIMLHKLGMHTAYMLHIYYNHATHIRHVYSIHAAQIYFAYMLHTE